MQWGREQCIAHLIKSVSAPPYAQQSGVSLKEVGKLEWETFCRALLRVKAGELFLQGDEGCFALENSAITCYIQELTPREIDDPDNRHY